MTAPNSDTVQTAPQLLRISAIAVAGLVIVQLVLGMMAAGDVHGIKAIHGYVGMATFLVAAIAGLAAWQWNRNGGPVGVMAHSIGIAVLMIVQIGLGEGGMKVPHMLLGFLVVLGGLALPVVVLDRKQRG